MDTVIETNISTRPLSADTITITNTITSDDWEDVSVSYLCRNLIRSISVRKLCEGRIRVVTSAVKIYEEIKLIIALVKPKSKYKVNTKYYHDEKNF